MRHASTLVLALCLATAVGCTQGRKGEAPPSPGFSDEGVGAQNRIGRHLQSSVVGSKLRTCWGQLKGEGAVAMDLTYRKTASSWVFESVKATRSSLPPGNDAMAQRCVADSARGTMFPVDSKEPLEAAAPQFIVRLAFSVPLPAEGTQLTTDQIARMIGPGGSGGVITVSGCSDCVPRTEYPYGLKCVAKKSGSNVDCEEISSNVCATTPRACLRGVFGGTSGVIMY
jgi:hypothetical protein